MIWKILSATGFVQCAQLFGAYIKLYSHVIQIQWYFIKQAFLGKKSQWLQQFDRLERVSWGFPAII